MVVPDHTLKEKLITGEELLAMGDIGRAELIDGRIVSMSPTGGQHGYLELEMGVLLHGFVRSRKLGWVMTGEVGFYIHRNPDRVRAPDVAFVSRQRMPERPRQEFLNVAPELVIEIVSPSDRWDEIRQKLYDYFSIGVERVWICEPDQNDVLVFRSPQEFETFGLNAVLKGEGVLEGFELSIADLFGDT